jgi:hypothetical protein
VRTGLSLAVLVALLGCVRSAPVVLKGDESFVTVSRPAHTSKAAVREVAEDYCQQYGKRSVLLSDACPEAQCDERTITFWCQ